MHKRKNIIYIICIIMITVIAVTIIAEVNEPVVYLTENPIYANGVHIDTLNPDKDSVLINGELEAADVLIASNTNCELYLNYEDFAIKVRNLTTGYIWNSIVSHENAENVSMAWRNFSQAIIAADFIDISSGYTKDRVTLLDEGGVPPVITLIDNGFKAVVTFPATEVSCELIIQLTEKGISAQIPYESIKQGETYAISKLYVLPMFGSVLEDQIPGYIVIPDGSGALIRFEKTLNYERPYEARIYGKDLGVKEYSLKTDFTTFPTVEDEPATMPIFGISHGKNSDAYLAVIQEGELSCDVIAAAASTELAYNRASARFVYRETFWQPTGGESGFNLIQSDSNIFDANVEYIFLNGEDANYTGMALEYADQLIEEGILPATSSSTGNIPIKLDIIIAEQAQGFISEKTKILTEFSDIRNWVSDFATTSLDNIIYSLIGFEKGGISGHKVGNFTFEKKAGNIDEIKSLADEISASGNKLIFQTDLTSGYSHQFSRKDIKFRESGQYALTLRTSLLYNERLFLNDKTVASIIDSLSSLPDYMNMFALDSIAMNLTSNYRKNTEANRYATFDNVVASLTNAKESTEFLMLEEPNVYAVGFADGIYNMPLTHSKLMFERDAIPFIQTVYSGHVDCYSDNLNYAGDDKHPLLKLIEFNTYPSYVISAAQSAEFADTNSNHIYSSKYEDWREDIIKGYEFVNDYLSQVRGCTVVSRIVPDTGVSITEYSNGVSIAINFNDIPYVYEGTLIEAGSAMIIRQGT